MSVVAVSYCFPPGRFAQSPQIARFVAAIPGDVSVIAGDDPSVDDSLLTTVGDIRVDRFGWSRPAMLRRIARRVTLGSRWGRPDAYRPWADAVARRCAPRIGPADTVVTFGQPMSDHLIGLAWATRAKAFVAHFSDPWIGNPYHNVGWSAGWQAVKERAVVKAAAAVVVTSEETGDMFTSRYDVADRVHVIAHSFDATLYPPFEASETIVVRHVGAFYGPRSPEPLFRALELLLERGEDLGGVQVEMVGPGGDWLASPTLGRLPAGLVRHRGAVPYLESLALMRTGSLLLVIDAPAKRNLFLPSKLVEYAGAERPIVALSPPGASSTLVDDLGGHVAAPDDIEAAASALLAGIATGGNHAGTPWGKRDVRERYGVDAQRAQIAALFERLG